MARDHARLLYRVWSDPEFLALIGDAQRVFCLGLSQPTINFAGVVPLTVKRWAMLAADSTEKKIRSAIAVLGKARFTVADWNTEELLYRSYVRNDGILSNPNIAVASARAYRQTASPLLRAVYLIELRRLWCEESQATSLSKAWTPDKPERLLMQALTDPVPKGVPKGVLEELYDDFPNGFLDDLAEGFSLTRARDARVALAPSPAIALAPLGVEPCMLHPTEVEPCQICHPGAKPWRLRRDA